MYPGKPRCSFIASILFKPLRIRSDRYLSPKRSCSRSKKFSNDFLIVVSAISHSSSTSSKAVSYANTLKKKKNKFHPRIHIRLLSRIFRLSLNSPFPRKVASILSNIPQDILNRCSRSVPEYIELSTK